MTAAEDHRRTVDGATQAIAPGWEHQRACIEAAATPLRDWLIRELAPRSGDIVLELAAGAGDTVLDAAAIVGEHGRMISTDFSPAMGEVARRRGAELARSNEEYRMDAERIELDDDAVDGVLRRGIHAHGQPPSAIHDRRGQ